MRRRLALLVALLLALPTSLLSAAPIPFGDAQVSIVAREEPIADFLRDLFGQVGRPVTVAPSVTGSVNGTFRGPARDVFRDIARAFNLASYFDGTIVYIHPASEVTSRTYPASPATAQRTLRAVGELGLTDTANRVRVTSTGLLVATGTPRFLEQVGEIARAQAGVPEPPATALRAGGARAPAVPPPPREPEALEFRVFYLRYARADDTVQFYGGRELQVPGLATILRSLVLDPTEAALLRVPSVRPIRQSQPRLGGRGLAALPPEPFQADTVDPVGAVDPYAVDDYAVIGGDTTVRAGSPSVVRIQADPTINAVIVRDAPARMPSYEALIRALDVEPQIVEIEATIIDVNTQRLRELGIDWSLTLRELAFGVNSINPGARAPNVTAIIGDNDEFIARISALEARNAARIVARPQVLTLANYDAVFDRTRTFYVRVAGEEEVDLFNVTAGTVLRVNPHVFRDRGQTRIRVLISIEDGFITPASVDEIPVVERSLVNTQAMILEGESLLIGGLTVDSQDRSREKIPVLGDIPIVGNLFRNSRTEVGRLERLFLITPRLASLDRRAAAMANSQQGAQP